MLLYPYLMLIQFPHCLFRNLVEFQSFLKLIINITRNDNIFFYNHILLFFLALTISCPILFYPIVN